MKKIVTIMLLLASNAVFACSLVAENAYAKASVPGMDNSSGYLDLKNTTDKDILITGVSSEISKATELHTMSMKNDKMVMRKIESIKVPAGQTVKMQGGFHVMFIGLNKPLKEGDSVKIKLQVEGKSSLEVSLPVQAGKKSHSHHSHDKHSKKSSHEHKHEHAHH